MSHEIHQAYVKPIGGSLLNYEVGWSQTKWEEIKI